MEKSNKIKRIFIFLYLFLLSACLRADLPTEDAVDLSSATTHQTSSVPIPKPSDTRVFMSESSPAVSSINYPNIRILDPKRCYFLVRHPHIENGIFRAIECDTQEVFNVELPEGAYIFPFLRQSLSPDGHSLILYSKAEDLISELELLVFDFVRGEITIRQSLVSQGYEEIFKPQYDFINQVYPDLGPESVMTSILESQFEFNLLQSKSWNPDGNELAFACQDGAQSSELLVINLDNQETRRLTEDLFPISSIFWSPYGDWISFTHFIPSRISTGRNLHVIADDSELVSDIPVLEGPWWWRPWFWISKDALLISDAWDGPEDTGLRYIEIPSGNHRMIFDDSFMSFDYDHEREIFAISGFIGDFSVDEPEIEYGTWIVDLEGVKKKISDVAYWSIQFVGGNDTEFIGLGDSFIDSISSDGVTTLIEGKDYSMVTVSPDGEWIILDDGDWFEVYTTRGESLFSSSDVFIDAISWHPQSSGFYVIGNPGLHYFDILDMTFEQVYICSESSCYSSYDNVGWFVAE